MTEFPELLRIETATLSAWPALATALDGLWLARFARGYTKRSNCLQCLAPSDDANAPERLARMVDLFLLNDLTPIFRVTPLAGPGVTAALDAGNWQPFSETSVLAMPLAPDPLAESAEVRVTEATDPVWIEALGGLVGATPRDTATLTAILGLIAWRTAGILVRDREGETVAAAMAVAAGGIGVCHNVVTHPDRQRQGFGRAAMAAALDWSRAAGATHAALQVVGDNLPALGLYHALGFSEVYRYHYRSPA